MIEATTVSALARYLKDFLDSNLTLTGLWVEGEISNLTKSQRGHVYFTLKDALRLDSVRDVPAAVPRRPSG